MGGKNPTVITAQADLDNHDCLLPGALEPRDAARAGWLLALTPGSEYARWLLTEACAAYPDWGWAVLSKSPMLALRQHLPMNCMRHYPGWTVAPEAEADIARVDALWREGLSRFGGPWLAGADWGADYLHWEMRLLDEMGFGLDLTGCAVTGTQDGLAYVSPRTGRAVTRAAAGEWADRLLPRPDVLVAGPADAAGLTAGLLTTGHFMERWLAEELVGRPLPEARRRLVVLLSVP